MKFQEYRLYDVVYNNTPIRKILSPSDDEAVFKAYQQGSISGIGIKKTNESMPESAYNVTKQMLTKLLNYEPSDDEIWGHWRPYD